MTALVLIAGALLLLVLAVYLFLDRRSSRSRRGRSRWAGYQDEAWWVRENDGHQSQSSLGGGSFGGGDTSSDGGSGDSN